MGSTRVSAPPEWAAPPPEDPDSTIDPVYVHSPADHSLSHVSLRLPLATALNDMKG